MATPLHLSRRISLATVLRPSFLLFSASRPPFSSVHLPKPTPSISLNLNLLTLSHSFSTTQTPYPLQYDLITTRPDNTPPPRTLRRPPTHLAKSQPADSGTDSEQGFNDWVDRKLASNQEANSGETGMDKSKRKYYNKRMKRMYGSDSDDESNRDNSEGFVELKPEVVEFRRLHKREEELYFYDTFAYPWEKEKHYKMMYQLEKKYFPDQCFDKAFLEPGVSNNKAKTKGVEKKDEGLVFFEDAAEEEKSVEENEKGLVKDVDVTEKKVGEFFKCLKKGVNENSEVASTEPFIATRSTGLPPKWDSPTGTMVLVNKPKGETLFCVFNG